MPGVILIEAKDLEGRIGSRRISRCVWGENMNYKANFDIQADGLHMEDAKLSIEKEGIGYGKGRIDFSEVVALKPMNHRVYITLQDGKTAEVSMLGFSFDGFWEELVKMFGARTGDSLFIEEEKLMDCEGEYELPESSIAPREAGRGRVQLYTDALCILPVSSHAVRVPLCYTEDITLNGYVLSIRMRTGEIYTVGRMGYDTQPFAERCVKQAKKTKEARGKLLGGLKTQEPFTEKGLFRTVQTEEYWLSAYGKNCCAVELFTKDQAATYLYRFEDRKLFTFRLEEAMEAVGSHREIIFLAPEELADKPLYRMAIHRSEAVRFLRSCSAGRIIHTAAHGEKLREFLNS